MLRVSSGHLIIPHTEFSGVVKDPFTVLSALASPKPRASLLVTAQSQMKGTVP